MIVITGRGKSDKITFLIYDDNFELQFIHLYTPELDDPSIEGITDSRGKGRPTFRPFGITSDEDNIYIANHTKTGIYDINDYSFKGLLPIMSFFNTHQILKKDNIMYVANTNQNSIGIHNLDDGSSFFKFLPAKSHCNSLFYSDDLYYVLHNIKLKPALTQPIRNPRVYFWAPKLIPIIVMEAAPNPKIKGVRINSRRTPIP